MGIEKTTMYTCKCDNCGEYYEYDGMFPVFSDEIGADNSVRNYGAWIKHEGKYYCPNCYEIDENEEVRIKEVKA